MSDPVPGLLLLVIVVGLVVFFTIAGLHWLYTNSSIGRENAARARANKLYRTLKKRKGMDVGQFAIMVANQIDPIPDFLERPLFKLCAAVYDLEDIGDVPKPPPLCDSVEGARYIDRLAEMERQDDVEEKAKALARIVAVFSHAFPDDDDEDFTTTIPNVNAFVEEVVRNTLQSSYQLINLAKQVGYNFIYLQKEVPPTAYEGDDVVDAYLRKTPLADLFQLRVPVSIPQKVWFEHAHIVAPSGAGKTQLLSQLFLKLHENGAVVAVDSQGDWIGKLRRLKKIQNRVLYIDPRDPPTVNLFKADIMEYLFSVQGSDLTAKQRVFFSFLTRLMREVPNATMMDVLRALHDIKPYMQYVENLPEVQRLFLEKDYNTSTFSKTKEEVRYRINSLLEHPTMERLFTSSEQAIDIGSELNKGTIILIDTSLGYLKGASAPFGKIFIALVLQAIQDRAAIPENERRPAYFFCDEAAAYFDKNITDLLEMARKYKMSCTFAHQQLSQCTPDLRASLMGNTSIKMVTQNAVDDAKALAPNMRTTADFILAQPKLTFAAYIRGVTGNAVAITVTPGLLEREPMVAPFPVKEPKTERQAAPRRDASGNTEADEVQETPTHVGEADVSAQPTVAAHDAPSASEPEPVRSRTKSPRAAEKRGSADTPSTDATEAW